MAPFCCASQANFKGKGEWFPAEITRARANATFDVLYDDGDKETRMELSWIRFPSEEPEEEVPAGKQVVRTELRKGDLVRSTHAGGSA